MQRHMYAQVNETGDPAASRSKTFFGTRPGCVAPCSIAKTKRLEQLGKDLEAHHSLYKGGVHDILQCMIFFFVPRAMCVS